ncbi:MAG: M3 family oligoendopeptidase [Gemmatimonadetes bacterium]|nr:M3 family oligoendopeptidase [Gemmatimonadota bacterium]NNF43516.1 M3 family oligoendopeptidase [Phycisphaerales bacterium]NNM25375.1 M3 family oligoendopeptidase [Phycisphaerales bacterium]
MYPMSTVTHPPAGPTDFVPADIDATRWETLAPLYQALLDRALKCANCLEQLILDRSELDAAAAEARANLYIRMTCHTDDEAAKKGYLDFVENVSPKLKETGFELDRKIVESPHRDGLDTQRYEVLLRDLTAEVELYRPENVPLETEDTKLGQEFSEVAGAMTVEFEGKERTLPEMATYLEVTDRATREAAWRGVSERRYRDHETLSVIFDKMLDLRGRIARNADFDNYRDYAFKAMHRFDYGPAACADFHRGAEEVCVPVMRSLNRERQEALGVESLRPWDLGVDIKGRDPLRPFKDVDELVTKTSKIFHRLDPELGAMFDSLRDGESLDLATRKGKAPGGYQENRDRIRKPFIFMNAAGMQNDLETMIHEAGHAFHSILCRADPLLHYRHAPIEFCEVASMSMELICQPYLGEFYDDAEAARARRVHLEALARLIPWIATIDAFQHWLYTNPGHDRATRQATWLELNDRFGAAVDWTGLEQFRAVSWQRQLHLFEVPFYYIEYGIAQLGALQLWLQAREDQNRAMTNYRRAMTLGGARPLPELFAAAELEFDFGPPTMKRLMDAVAEELESLPL